MELTILMPCLDEAETLGTCIARAQELLARHGIDGEVLVSDNGSTDGSREIARRLGARVVDCPVRGYGAALQHGIEHARGAYILMGDSDDSYRFDEAFPLVEKLREGYDLCMGTRLRGTIMPGAMPLLNRYLGNPVLSGIGKLLFATGLSDFHCGMRAFRRDKVLRIGLVTTGMEWASEHVIKSRLNGLKMAEVPIRLHKDGRSRPPHLRRWRDGWRHLRFMLIHAPTWLFILPGAAMLLLGTVLGGWLATGPVRVGRAVLDIHTLLVASSFVVLGTQAIFTGLFVHLYGHLVGVLPYRPRFARMVQVLSLEKLLLVALAFGAAGAALFGHSFLEWLRAGFPPLDARTTMRQVIPGVTMLTMSAICMFNGFMLSTLFLATRRVSYDAVGNPQDARDPA